MSIDFIDAIRDTLGYAPDHTPLGIRVRFPTSEKRGDKNGWAKLFPDGEGGVYGCWRTGEKHNWFLDVERDPEQQRKWEKELELRRAEAHREQQRLYGICRRISQSIWRTAEPVNVNNEYVVRKKIKPYGARMMKGMILVPVFDPKGFVRGLQYISANGDKKFKRDTEVQGGYAALGSRPEAGSIICEGWATGCTLHEATGLAVCVAFNAGNLIHAAREMRYKYPEIPLLIAADDDWKTEGNPGLRAAIDTAEDVKGTILYPKWPPGAARGDKDTDFNDLAVSSGLDAVIACTSYYRLKFAGAR